MGLVRRRLDIDRELPPLAGFVGLTKGSDATAKKPGPQLKTGEVDSQAGGRKPGGVSAVIISSLAACTLVGLAVMAAGFFLGRNK